MLSRTVFRSLPRTTSRLTSRTTSAFIKPTTNLSLRRSPTLIQSLPRTALFTTTSRLRDDVSQELSAKLSSEITLEQENTEAQHDSDENVNAFLSQNDYWTLEAPEGQQEVILRRQYDDEIITVAFSIVDFNAAGMEMADDVDDAFIDEEEELAGGSKGAINAGTGGKANPNFKVAPEDSIAASDTEDLRAEEEDYESQQAFPANVRVLIQRAGKGALRIQLVTDNGRFTIEGVTHLPESSPTTTVSDILRNTPEQLYTGPPFQQLDEEVQGLLEQYLDVRGINTALALFIPDYIDVKEQKEYLGWLQRVRDFVDG